MSFYTPFAYFVIVAAVLAYAGTPLFSAADIAWHDETSRTSTIDGLRGFLATGVFFHHAAIYYLYLLTGVWRLPPSFFYTQLGQSGVSLFFMITGYLFWGKAIRACGHLDWRALYLGRIFRIAPLYYLAVLLMLFVVFRQTDFMLLQSPLTLIRQIAPLALFGFKNPASIINTYPSPGLILAGVTWTLHYEWLFYLSLLPVAAVFARKYQSHLWFSLTSLIISFTMMEHTHSPSWIAATDFLAGMACVSIQQHKTVLDKHLSDNMKSVIAIILLALVFSRFDTAYTAVPILMLATVFFLVTSGCTLFGLLQTRAARRLGEISYGIYILQGLALYAIFAVPSLRLFALGSALHYWMVIAVAAAGLVTFALLAHIVLELPGINAGKILIKKLNRNRPEKTASTSPSPTESS